jgi:putative ABC transport system permease protein
MTGWSRIRSWVRATVRRSEMETEMDAELHFHLEKYAEDLMRRGMSGEAAMRRARLKFGGVERAKEECREARGVSFLETFWQDLRYGARTLRKSPGFTIIAALTLALGIGANTAIFSLVNGILLRPLPYPNPEQLVSITGTYPKGAFVTMREQVKTLSVGMYSENDQFNLTGYGEAVRLAGTRVSAELLSLLGARPQLGRTFTHGEDVAGQDNYVVLSDTLWRDRFAADSAIIGRVIQLDGTPRQVIGVLSPDFGFPSPKTQMWVPLHNDPRDASTYWSGAFMPVIGRLFPGQKLSQANAEIQIFQTRVSKMFPWPMPATWNADVSTVPLQDGMVVNVRARLLMLLGAVGLVLLIACANVANLTLSKAATREKEMAIRTALGAGRRRVVTQVLTESLLLSALGGVLGLILAKGGLLLLKGWLPANMPRLVDVTLDWRVLAFTAGLTILTGIFFGLAPALQSSRVSPAESLKSGARGTSASVSQRLRGLLVTVEVALAVMLVLSAGLFIRSFWAVSHVDPGFRFEQVLTARITPNPSFCNDANRCLAFYRSVLDQVRSVQGVSDAALINTLPLGGRVLKRVMDVEDHLVAADENASLFWMHVVSPDYFRVMRIGPLAGRAFTPADENGSPVAVVTAATARHYWRNQTAVGKHIRLSGEQEWHTVVGIIPDVRAYDITRYSPQWIDGIAYVPYNAGATLEGGNIPAEMTIAVRAQAAEAQLKPEIQRIVGGLNPEVPVSELKSMSNVFAEAVATPASTASLFTTFAGVALMLGMIGVYGVLSFLVSKRTREIGIRMALGARRKDVLWLVMKEGAKFSFAGIALGLAGAVAVTRLLSSELYGIGPMDAATYVSVTSVMVAVTMLACYVPTRRAMRVDPLIALRQD